MSLLLKTDLIWIRIQTKMYYDKTCNKYFEKCFDVRMFSSQSDV
jgi:hypothetical protein